MRYLDFLSVLHERLEPSTYLEVGIRNGNSLALARCRSVGIDPAYQLTAELDGDVALFRTISDEYFSRPEPLAPFDGRAVDLAFIDGLHLFEFALRDFINVERHASPTGVIVFDDVFPRSIDEAARQRHTKSWTGDVYKVLAVLQQHRPDLTCLRVGTQPTGLLVVLGLDPTSTVLADAYDQIVADHVRPDPQVVPADILSRITALPPQRVLDAPIWQLLRDGGAELPASACARPCAPAWASGRPTPSRRPEPPSQRASQRRARRALRARHVDAGQPAGRALPAGPRLGRGRRLGYQSGRGDRAVLTDLEDELERGARPVQLQLEPGSPRQRAEPRLDPRGPCPRRPRSRAAGARRAAARLDGCRHRRRGCLGGR